jgi:drug/metabolite transporter (DMT)-like permease
MLYCPNKLMPIRYLAIFYGVFTDILYFDNQLDLFTLIGSSMIFSIAIFQFLENTSNERNNKKI